jgi:hypothetical protein
LRHADRVGSLGHVAFPGGGDEDFDLPECGAQHRYITSAD